MGSPFQRALGSRLALLVAALAFAAGTSAAADRYSFATLDGPVVAIGEHRADGDLRLLAIDLAPDGKPGEPVRVLLGPPAACEEIGFEVEVGDRVRVRIFVAPEGGPVKAQRVLNESRGLMVHFRTTHDIPLWNAAGAWQGGPGRAWRGGHRGPGSRGERPGGGGHGRGLY